KEIQVWSFLDHENVLPLIGLCVVNNELGMVSELMPNGNVQEYIQRNPSVDRHRLAIDICAGLVYLHEHPKHIVVHGDLKAVNVVVNADGIPKLTDFGLAQMVRAEDSTERSSSSNVGGTARWMAYEQICPTAPDTVCQKPNASSDVYSLGMVSGPEIFSGKLPFAELRNDAQVIHAIMQGKLPERTPNAFSDPVWELLNQCWRRNPRERPTARYVLNALQQINLSTN
ncbi:kinase-like protein, partial [Ceratobasidium sp. AG-I]